MSSAYLQYAKVFEENGMSLDFLLSGNITDQDLVALGMTNQLHRKRILYEIDQEKQRRSKREHDYESPASEPDDDEDVSAQNQGIPILTVDDTTVEGLTSEDGAKEETPLPSIRDVH